ncbi:adhesin [Pseudoalteromonas luteoviolacea]|nr:adhesin [Pseudoalteromonas luteoviolacea]
MRTKLILSCILFSGSALSQDCATETSVPFTTPESRFVVNNDGTVCDKKTEIMWQRCTFGFVYNATSETCDNEEQKLSWQEALSAAKSSRVANFDDWQLPNVKELSSIVERSCEDPAINATVFLGNHSGNYWSSTTNINDPSRAWTYQFQDGLNDSSSSKSSDAFVRLMRYAACE